MVPVGAHVDETPTIRTVRLNASIQAIPGQFVMVWVPGVDEFPMSVSYIGRKAGITYKVLGEGTKALARTRVGDMIGIRGPYGHGFERKGKRVLVVAGGTGMAALAPLLDAGDRHSKVDLVLGARTEDELLFERRARRAGADVHVATDDGSRGVKGLATDLAETLLEEIRYDSCYACGPEMMLLKLLRMSHRRSIPMQASLERIIKCGIGICDSCAIDGKHVCTDGPVFGARELSKLSDLGKKKRDACGREVKI